ncbi:MAG: ABC transporter permease [Stellaceae bacterium]
MTAAADLKAAPAVEGLLDRVAADHAAQRRRAAASLGAGRTLLILAIVLAWQIASNWFLDPFFFSSPTAIARAFVDLLDSGRLLTNAGYTMLEAVTGYVLGAVCGVLVATLLGSARRLYAIVEPFILALYSVPAVALAPLVIVWFGIGITPKILLAAYFVFFIVLMNGIAGFRSIPAGWLDAVRLLGATPTQLFFQVRLRAAASFFSVGLKAAVPLAVVGAMVGEFISSQHGMGYLIADSSSRFVTAEALAAILFLALFVLALTYLFGIGPGRRGAL